MALWGLTVLRVAVGIVFLAHGAQKLFGAFGGGGLSGTSAYFTSLQLEPAYPLALLWALIEFGCGLLVFLGAWTRWAAIPLAIGMAVAVWKVHLPHGFFINWALAPGIGHGYEMNLVLMAACVCLSLSGAGELSIDKLLHRNAEYAYAGRQRIRGM
ncbi:MAG: DoxX family protein [Vicinamibacterales bacterium]